jgi:hypothetical protein
MGFGVEKKESLVILAATVGATGQLQGFLSGRGWDVTVTMDLDQALTFIVLNKPSYVMVSGDHKDANAKIAIEKLLLPGSAKVIMFSEKVASSTGTKVKGDDGFSLKMPITGSNFLRVIERIDAAAESQRAEGAAPAAPPERGSAAAATPPQKAEGPGEIKIGEATHKINDIEKVMGSSIERALSAVCGAGKLPGKGTQGAPSAMGGAHAECFLVCVGESSGYLIAAVGKDEPINELLSGYLVEEVKKSFPAGSISSIRHIEAVLPSFSLADFAAWCQARAYSRQYEESELGAAFIKSEDGPMAIPAASQAGDMLRVRPSAIAPGKPVDFDVYHHLKLAKKYLKLAHKGHVVDETRLNKWKSKAEYLHAKKHDAEALDLYRAKAALPSLVDRFLSSQKKQAS